jgi:hypothetical protein
LLGFKVSGSWRFKSSDLEAWIENQKDKEWWMLWNLMKIAE